MNISNEDLIYELEQAKQSKLELEAKMLWEGDAIAGADSHGDVYLSDMLHAVEENIDALTLEAIKRVSNNKRGGTTNESG